MIDECFFLWMSLLDIMDPHHKGTRNIVKRLVDFLHDIIMNKKNAYLRDSHRNLGEMKYVLLR